MYGIWFRYVLLYFECFWLKLPLRFVDSVRTSAHRSMVPLVRRNLGLSQPFSLHGTGHCVRKCNAVLFRNYSSGCNGLVQRKTVRVSARWRCMTFALRFLLRACNLKLEKAEAFSDVAKAKSCACNWGRRFASSERQVHEMASAKVIPEACHQGVVDGVGIFMGLSLQILN